MSQPTRGNVHVNRPLTNISIMYMQAMSKYIATRLFPNVVVQKQGDLYYKFKKGEWFRSNSKKRAPGTESAGGGYSLETDSYFAHVYAFHKDIADQTRANTDLPLNSDRNGTQFVTNDLLIGRERNFITSYFTTGIWGADITPATKWDAAGSDPIDDIEAQMDAVEASTGYRPNKFTVTPDVHRALKNNASILDRIKHTQVGTITEDILAGLLGVDEYLVARATNNTAKEGAADAMSYMFGTQKALLTYSPKQAGLEIPSAGYTFSWNDFGAVDGMRMKKFRMEKLESDRVEAQLAYDMKQVASDLGIFFDAVLT